MRPPTYVSSLGFALSLLLTPVLSRAGTNLVFNGSQGQGPNYDQAIWKTNNGTQGGTGTALAPSAGNTYTLNSNSFPIGNNLGTARLRNNVTNSGATETFAGDSLTLTTNTEIRFKRITTPTGVDPIVNYPGVGGNPGLIFRGGMVNPGDDMRVTIAGKVQVATAAYISGGDNGGGGTLRPNRRFTISADLSGSGPIVIFQCLTNTAEIISSPNNTFSGPWIVRNGWLQGATNNSLGTNSITCDPQYVLPSPPFAGPTTNVVDISTNISANVRAVVEANYLLNSAGVLTLTNGGMMRLHGVACFTDAVIEGTHLATGVHYYSELFGTWPANFDDGGLGAGGFGAIVIQPFGTPPPLPPSILKQPISTFAYTDGAARFAVTATDLTGSPLTYQWRSNGVNITSSRFFGATNTILVISNPAPAEAVNYDVVVSNPSIGVASSVATFTIVAPTGEAYEAAVRTAKPVAFYQLNETADPSSGSAAAYDLAGGYYGIYGAAVQNGFNTTAGPESTDGLPGFAGGNFAVMTTLNVVNNRITALPWNLNANTVTLTAWVYPNSAQNPNEGLVFCRGGTTVAGLCYASAAGGASLGYNWNNEADTFNWNSGITPAPGQWSLVALVVTPTKASIYVLSTNTAGQLTLAASQHVYNHASLQFDGTTLIGDDSGGANGNRTFNGKIDDVAVFNRALSQDDLLALFSAASGTAGYAPQIAVQPVGLSLFQTQTAQFTALAIGSDPLTYQWQSAPAGSGGPYVNVVEGGKNSGSATPVLTISAADFANQADYILVASNPSGSATSTVANLTINATNGSPINITMTASEPGGQDWDLGPTAAIGANTNWSDFNPASYSAAQSPGNTYELLPGARLRTPVGPSVATFPGRQLTVNGDGIWRVNPGSADPTSEVRFKQSTYGTTSSGVDGIVNGTVNFRKLVMNGGQLDAGADAGNNANMVIVGGEIDILGNTAFNGDGGNDRGYRIDAFLTGTSGIEYHGYNPATFQSNYVNNLNITCPTNAFSGTWTVVAGTLLGTAPNALGTNHIFVGTNGAVETTYDLVNTSAYLVLQNGGKMFLHQTNRFRSAVVSGVSLPVGTNTFAALNASFPGNFPAIWAPKIGATNFTAGSGMIIVLSNAAPLITAQPLSVTNRGQLAASFSVTAVGGLPLAYQWRAGVAGSGVFTNLPNGGNISGATNATVTISNLSAANAGDYSVVVTNAFGSATSLVARLTVLDAPFITLQPVSHSSSGAASTNFLVSALGDLPLAYQWQAAAIGSGGPYTNLNNGVQISGATTTNLIISNLALTNSADYLVIVSNPFGSATSIVATLTVADPLLTQDASPPGTVTVYQQSSAQWSVGILGTPPLVSRWQGGEAGSGIFTNLLNGGQVSGATSTVLTIANVDFHNAGDFRYIVSNVSGSVTSSVVTLTVAASSAAQAYTLDFGGFALQQPQGADWNTLSYWNPDGDSAANSAPAHPGSSYTVVPGARLRTPATNSFFPGYLTPGIQLIVAGNGVWINSAATNDPIGELRFKHSNPGTNYFNKLVMNGGQIDNGDNGLCVIQGEMDILANTPIYVDSSAAQDRAYRIESWLTGSGNIEWRDFDSSFNSVGGLAIAGTSNTYSGTWHAVRGTLLGVSPNALGTNSITVDAGAALETSYNLNTPTANLTLNGQMFLHTSDTFRTVTIGNYLVPAGTYSYAQWAASFPANFPASWNLQTGSTINTASGSITVLAGSAVNTITNNFIVQGTNLVFSGTGGLPNGKYYVLSTANVALPKASWTKSGPYPFDNLGNFGVTIPIVPGVARQFYQLQQIIP